MTTELTSGIAPAVGADLYFERRGGGPPLLLIVGGGGDCGYYDAMGRHLAARYTVLTYDRRGNSRSPRHSDQAEQTEHAKRPPITISEQAADAIAVLQANGFSAARIFGNSGGATIALELAAHHPGVVHSMICHEPPVPLLLPDPRAALAEYAEVDRVLAEQGWRAAFTSFQAIIGGMSGDQAGPMTALLTPELMLSKGPVLDLMRRMSRNWEYMMTCEVRPFIDYEPDLDKIIGNKIRLAIGYGASTRNPVAARMSEAIAQRLGADCGSFPGGHTGPLVRPTGFAAALLAAFDQL